MSPDGPQSYDMLNSIRDCGRFEGDVVFWMSLLDSLVEMALEADVANRSQLGTDVRFVEKVLLEISPSIRPVG